MNKPFLILRNHPSLSLSLVLFVSIDAAAALRQRHLIGTPLLQLLLLSSFGLSLCYFGSSNLSTHFQRNTYCFLLGFACVTWAFQAPIFIPTFTFLKNKILLCQRWDDGRYIGKRPFHTQYNAICSIHTRFI